MSRGKKSDTFEFKKKPFEQRRQESEFIVSKFPNKIPIIMERFYKEKQLPYLNKAKFLVPHDITVAQFITLIRVRMQLRDTHAISLMAGELTLVSLGSSIKEIYASHADADGFLYLTYASQDMFG